MQARLEPAFLDGFSAGRRFTLWIHPPTGAAVRGAILCVQPFGEEANLARRVLVAQAVRLAARGWTTLIVDLFGTGDSDGATGDVSLASWRADLLLASRLARERAPGAFVLWGIRFGALLAAELAVALDQLASGIVFWQPPANGAQLIDPLVKLSKLGAIARARNSDTGSASADPRSAEASGEPGAAAGAAARADLVDLAGYRLARGLLDDLRTLETQPPSLGEPCRPYPVLMLGVQRVVPAGAVAPKPLSELAGRWLAEGYLASLRVVQGEPFWSSLEPSTPSAAFAETEAFLETIAGDA